MKKEFDQMRRAGVSSKMQQRPSGPTGQGRASHATHDKPSRVASSNKKTKNRRKYIVIAAIISLVIVGAGVAAFVISKRTNQKTQSNEVTESYRKQLPELKKEVEKKPKDVGARRSYAVALYVARDLEEAKRQYIEAIKLNDKDAVLHNNLGNTYRDLKQYDKAIESYKDAIKLDKKNQNAYANLANIQLYLVDKPQDAIETYQAAIRFMPDNVQMKLLLGIAYEQTDRKQKAIEIYKDILAKDKNNQAAKANLQRLKKS